MSPPVPNEHWRGPDCEVIAYRLQVIHGYRQVETWIVFDGLTLAEIGRGGHFRRLCWDDIPAAAWGLTGGWTR